MTLAGKRVLVVEDEFLIALQAADILESAGAVVVGPAFNIPAALDLVADSDIDAALLDVNIGGEFSTPVALALREKRVPTILATGYGGNAPIERFGPILDKPYTPDQLLAAMAAL